MFIDKVRQFRKQNLRLADAIRKAIDDCLQTAILTDFLAKRQKEVSDMLTMEFDYDETLKVREEEAIERGLQRGFAQGIEKGIEKGRRESKMNTLLRQLTKKFKSVPSSYQQRLSLLEQDQLDRILDDIFDLHDISDLYPYFINA